ncbi:Putative odorant-binding protein A10 [Cyphomyrmex costatus]|uniref:Putative odorant-binding protein A10 n=1 Tax=Cyphomyrmex costatus TaxID=456900 RepID=A0A195CVR0_9HYME|nr:Putative odorant-binding protein A10 [Cyphomyrmex costatus]
MIRLSYVMIISVILMCVLAEELYSDKYDNTDPMSILQNDKLRDEWYNCFMEKAPCPTEDAKFFQEIFSESLQTKCKKCTQRQKELQLIMKNWYEQNNPERWKALVTKSIEDMKKKNAGR